MAEEPKIGDGAGPRALAKAVPPHETSAADRIRAEEFPMALRGYEREAVDRFIAKVADLVDTLESRQARETVVQRALEEVGEETSAILKQAHESADDITARSRSQAEDRVEVARQEAAKITSEARLEAAELKRATQDLEAERANLIEELRRIASETLTLADAAADRAVSTPSQEVVEAPVEEPVGPPVGEPVDSRAFDPADPPYDGAAEMDLTEEWRAEEDPGVPTEEMPVPLDEEREDEPPRPPG